MNEQQFMRLGTPRRWHVAPIPYEHTYIHLFFVGFFEHRLTFWHYQNLQVHPVYSVPQAPKIVFRGWNLGWWCLVMLSTNSVETLSVSRSRK